MVYIQITTYHRVYGFKSGYYYPEYFIKNELFTLREFDKMKVKPEYYRLVSLNKNLVTFFFGIRIVTKKHFSDIIVISEKPTKDLIDKYRKKN